MKTFVHFDCCFSLIYSFFLWSPMFLPLPSSIFFPWLDFLFFLHVKKCLPLISIYIFTFSSSDFNMHCFSCLEICTFPSPGWCPSTDLGGLEALWWWDLSEDPARQVARDITPLALACNGRVFFQSLQKGEWRFYLLLPYQLLWVSASKTEHLFSWVSMKRLLLDVKVQAWRLYLTPLSICI